MTVPRHHPTVTAKSLSIAAYKVRHNRTGKLDADEAATVPIDSDILALCWRGAARMAHARKAAGQPLDSVDRQALAHHPDCPPIDPRIEST